MKIFKTVKVKKNMNPMILNTASLLNNSKTIHNNNHGKFKTKGDFLSNILANLSRGQKILFHSLMMNPLEVLITHIALVEMYH